MGITNCEHHGYQGFRQLCPHVAAALRERRVLARRRGPELLDACLDCWDHYALEPPMTHAESLPEALRSTLTCECLECIAQTDLLIARAHGLPDPFTPFEFTLTRRQRDDISRLYDSLVSEFTFARSVVEPTRRALWVRPGAVTKPLSITIYYVTDPLTQDAIVQHVGAFLDATDRPECHLTFLRTENWIETAPGSHTRGPEEVLRRHAFTGTA